jgi:hypothetical protein
VDQGPGLYYFLSLSFLVFTSFLFLSHLSPPARNAMMRTCPCTAGTVLQNRSKEDEKGEILTFQFAALCKCISLSISCDTVFSSEQKEKKNKLTTQ